MPAQLLSVGSLLQQGTTYREIRRQLARGDVRRVRRGVLARGPAPVDAFEAMAERCRAALLVLPVGTLVSGQPAAALHRLLRPLPPVEPIDVLLPPGVRRDRVAGIRPHEGRPAQVAEIAGVRCTDLIRTVLDMAACQPRQRAVAIVDAATAGDSALLAEVRRRAAPELLPRRGRRLASRHVGEATGLAESPLETLTWLLFVDAGIPLPVQQAIVRHHGRFVGRVDFLWAAERLVIEVDGMAKYDDRGELQREKARQNDLIDAGYTVLRFTWADITRRPEAVVAQIRRALLRATG